MDIDLTGKSAVVTGAGGGIGRATAQALARLGAKVVLNDIGVDDNGAATAEVAAEAIRAAGGVAVASTASVTDFDAAASIIELARSKFGSIDILINNAGIAWNGQLWDLDPDTFEAVTSSHIKGAYNCMRHSVEAMKDKGWGRVVNLVSRAGIIGLPGTIPYAVGKGGLFGLTNAASRDLGQHGITVNAVNPTATYTPMVAGAIAELEASGPEGRERAESIRSGMQTAEHVAVLIAALCAPWASDVNGQVFLVERNRVALFQPLTPVQEVERDTAWSVADLSDALAKFQIPDLFDAYA